MSNFSLVEAAQSKLDVMAEHMRGDNVGSDSNKTKPRLIDASKLNADELKCIAAWPQPQSIPDTLLPVTPFDAALLPESLRPWICDIAERMQCPIDFPAVGAMVALSSVIGRKACIRPKRRDDWEVIPNLWGAVVGRPGVMKSPALSEVTKPLDHLAAVASEQYSERNLEHEVNAKIREMTAKANEATAQKLVKGGRSAEAACLLLESASCAETTPPLRRYKVTDATVEALGELLIENPWGTMVYRDEMSGLLSSLDIEGQEGARSFYLQGYDGNQSYTFDRIMRGKNLRIPAVCIAMLGGIQPGKLQAYINNAVNGGKGDDGLLQRFGMLVWPDIDSKWRNIDQWPNIEARATAYETYLRLDAMLPGTDPDTNEPAPGIYRFNPAAQEIFDDWRNNFETVLRSGDHHPAMESHLSKYRKLVPALALVCAMADGEAEVSAESTLRALAWSEYLQTHAARAYAAGRQPSASGAKALLAKIKTGAIANGFKPADVYLKGWTNLGGPEAVHSACALLCDLDCLRRVEIAPGVKGGRPSVSYRINPAILGKKAS